MLHCRIPTGHGEWDDGLGSRVGAPVHPSSEPPPPRHRCMPNAGFPVFFSRRPPPPFHGREPFKASLGGRGFRAVCMVAPRGCPAMREGTAARVPAGRPSLPVSARRCVSDARVCLAWHASRGLNCVPGIGSRHKRLRRPSGPDRCRYASWACRQTLFSPA